LPPHFSLPLECGGIFFFENWGRNGFDRTELRRSRVQRMTATAHKPSKPTGDNVVQLFPKTAAPALAKAA